MRLLPFLSPLVLVTLACSSGSSGPGSSLTGDGGVDGAIQDGSTGSNPIDGSSTDVGSNPNDGGSTVPLDAGSLVGTVSVNTTTGVTIPRDFAGLSVEYINIGAFFLKSNLDGGVDDGGEADDGGEGDGAVNPAPPVPQLLQLFKNLGAGTFRIGGGTVDEMCYSGTQNSRCAYFFGNNPIAKVFQAAALTGWKVIFGVNLGIDDPSYAVNEAVNGIIPMMKQYDAGALLSGIEIGNEPDLFSNQKYTAPLPDGGTRTIVMRDAGYNMSDIIDESAAYAQAFAANSETSALPLVGPALTQKANLAKMPGYASALDSVDPGRVAYLTAHFYPTYNCPGVTTPGIQGTIPNLLSSADFKDALDFVSAGVAAAQEAGVPFWLDEANSVACGGKNGVSNTLASAIWGLDYLLGIAQEGARGVNFHGPTGPTSYAPIATMGADATSPTAQPLYYAMLAFDQMAAGLQFVTAQVNATINVTAYAVQSGQTTNVFVINKDVNGGGEVNLTIPGASSPGELTVLAGPNLSAESGVTWGGASVDQTTGNFPGTATQTVPYDTNAACYHVPLVNGSAVVLSVPR